ncbi:hypothetical protein BT93_C1550 [Corymbia citriodora subsp. variegata]|nr:hypothetical protein BT93_C1550 [Corymbia citriodora subsp. variegata]
MGWVEERIPLPTLFDTSLGDLDSVILHSSENLIMVRECHSPLVKNPECNDDIINITYMSIKERVWQSHSPPDAVCLTISSFALLGPLASMPSSFTGLVVFRKLTTPPLTRSSLRSFSYF